MAGHLKVASKLVPVISQVTGMPVTSSPVRVTVPDAAPPQNGTTMATVHIEQALPESRRSATGTVLITPPPGFSVDRDRVRYQVGRDGTATVSFRLRGSGAGGGTGAVRVLVDGDVEALPVSLVVTGTSAVTTYVHRVW